MTKGRTWFPQTGAVGRPLGRALATKKKGPVDPLDGDSIALAGRVVTMNGAFAVRDDAVVYVEKSKIVAVLDRGQQAPAGFDRVAVIETGGTIFPGLIELHNHLAYDALPLWAPIP